MGMTRESKLKCQYQQQSNGVEGLGVEFQAHVQ